MTEATPKERYEARKELRRIARDPDEKRDADLAGEYALHLLDRAVTAFETFANAYASAHGDERP